MAAYNFKKQFAEAVRSGMKRQTIRAERKDGRRPVPGELLRLYYGMRTKQCELLAHATCKRVQDIWILSGLDPVETGTVLVDGRPLTPYLVRTMAVADGFLSEAEFFAFFRDNHGPRFEGVLIKW